MKESYTVKVDLGRLQQAFATLDELRQSVHGLGPVRSQGHIAIEGIAGAEANPQAQLTSFFPNINAPVNPMSTYPTSWPR